MAVSSTYKCDGCGKLKGEVNHWFVVTELAPQNGDTISSETLAIHRWPRYKDAAGVKHLCGAECVMKQVQRFLGKTHE